MLICYTGVRSVCHAEEDGSDGGEAAVSVKLAIATCFSDRPHQTAGALWHLCEGAALIEQSYAQLKESVYGGRVQQSRILLNSENYEIYGVFA